MNFCRPFEESDSLASKSKIRVLPLNYFETKEEQPADAAGSDTASTAVAEVTADANVKSNNSCSSEEDKALDRMLIQTSNEAALELLQGSTSASVFKERMLPCQTTIQPGDLVVILECFDKLDFVYVEPKGVFMNRNGQFHHDDFIGKPFGSKIRSRTHRGYGYIYLLKPTPELWARSLNHRTQIVHELDQAQIIHQLHLRPNMTVVETGTGSGAMSHAILRAIAPFGHLHTFEFNQVRAETARTEFAKNGVSHLVSVYHRDTCTDGFMSLPSSPPLSNENCDNKYGIQQPHSIDAVFLDLPAPWLALDHALAVLKPSLGRIASYSPCVEQTQKTVQAMTQCGFHTIKTMEYRFQEHYVDEVGYEPPPTDKRPKLEYHHVQKYNESAAAPAAASSNEEQSGDEKQEMGDNYDMKGETITTSDAPSTEEKDKVENSNIKANKPSASDDNGCDGDDGNTGDGAVAGDADGTTTKKKRVFTVARPFATMRGHTAFLTFATAPTLAAQQLSQK